MANLITRTLDSGYDSVLSVIYPHRCHVCGGSVERRALGVACERCWGATKIFDAGDLVCWKCGRPSGRQAAVDKPEDVRCHRCDDDAFTAARACGAYEGALRASVLALKRDPHICRRLKDMLLKTMSTAPLNQVTRITPVPLHPERQKTRGFNQAVVIAEQVSRVAAIQFDTVSLVRTRHVERHRAGMDLKDRRQTVDHSFYVTYPALIEGESILLIDDVFTTGATASACARALFNAGARNVFVLTIARPVHY